jgi:uncharacterized membrane protein
MTTFTRQALHSPRRSLAKTVTWRAIAALDTFLISLLITGSFAWAGSIVGIEALTKMALYYLHERTWGHVLWGIQALPAKIED